MTMIEKLKPKIKWLLSGIAIIALLVSNLDTIQKFFYPDKDLCRKNENQIIIASDNLKKVSPLLFDEKAITDLMPLLKDYFEHKSCKNQKIDAEINEIKVELLRIVGELLYSLKTQIVKENEFKLQKSLEILQLICSQKYCLETEEKQIDELIKTIQ